MKLSLKKVIKLKSNFESFVDLLNTMDEVIMGTTCYMRAFDDLWNEHNGKGKLTKRCVKTDSFSHNLFEYCDNKIFNHWNMLGKRDGEVFNLREYLSMTGFDGESCITEEVYRKYHDLYHDVDGKRCDEVFHNNMKIIKECESLMKKDRHIKNHNEWYELLASLVFWARFDVEQEMSC